MAGVGWSAATAEVASGTSVKTIIQVVAPTNQRLLIRQIDVSFEGTSSSDEPIQVDVLRQTSAGTMSSLTPQKWNSSDSETLQVTAQHTSSSEPTAGAILLSRKIHPQTSHTWDLGDPIPVPGGGRLGVRVTAAVSVGTVVTIVGEE